jgi:(2R)-3-sulfolactate dehydrogenase (NADP+)
MPRLSLDDVHDLSSRALVGSGATPGNAAPVADSIRQAEAEDLRNVGLAYLPVYCEHLRCGKIDGSATPTWRVAADATLLVDAAFGFAHPAFLAALDPFADMAGRTGTASMAITRSYSAGVVGWFIDHLAMRGLVSLAFANSSALMPPWGGNRPLLGTNPLGFGTPRASAGPIIVDMATSATARVNVVAAAGHGEPIPAGWALDTDGNPTTEPQAALDGMMAPLGGAKGYGLALMVDLLAGGLTGSNFSHESSDFGDNEGGPPGVGQLFVAFAPAHFSPAAAGSPRPDTYADRVERLSDVVHAQSARLPGERRHQSRIGAQEAGVEVPAELIARLEAYC